MLQSTKVNQTTVPCCLAKAIPRYQQFAAPWHVHGTPTQVNYVMVLQIGGLTNILRVWLGQDQPEPPEQIKDLMLLAAQQLADSLNTNQIS